MSVHKSWCEGQNFSQIAQNVVIERILMLLKLRLTHYNLTSDPNNHHNIQ